MTDSPNSFTVLVRPMMLDSSYLKCMKSIIRTSICGAENSLYIGQLTGLVAQESYGGHTRSNKSFMQ